MVLIEFYDIIFNFSNVIFDFNTVHSYYRRFVDVKKKLFLEHTLIDDRQSNDHRMECNADGLCGAYLF